MRGHQLLGLADDLRKKAREDGTERRDPIPCCICGDDPAIIEHPPDGSIRGVLLEALPRASAVGCATEGGCGVSGWDGGRAFPDAEGSGMSLRDWFAGQALAGAVSDAALVALPGKGRQVAQAVAESAYQLADAMLAVRDGAK